MKGICKHVNSGTFFLKPFEEWIGDSVPLKAIHNRQDKLLDFRFFKIALAFKGFQEDFTTMIYKTFNESHLI
jgi:hypothetical protein